MKCENFVELNSTDLETVIGGKSNLGSAIGACIGGVLMFLATGPITFAGGVAACIGTGIGSFLGG